MKKIPLRTCVVTKEKLPKEKLIRVVKNKNNEVFIDNEKGKANGRGAYIKKDISVLEKAIKNNSLGKVLRIDIPESIYEDLKNKINI